MLEDVLISGVKVRENYAVTISRSGTTNRGLINIRSCVTK